ncbi:FRG domain-containing protein [Prosthecochloris sp.]|uniref:FRG domain-containing protein n=1 Tax=Prosthecochloris sp. TaxID=290513 RepID=UPI0025E70A7B|nr:FRG domain-containing protein [Prosthecochloris sp.]
MMQGYRINVPLYDFISYLKEVDDKKQELIERDMGLYFPKGFYEAFAIDDDFFSTYPIKNLSILCRGQNEFYEKSFASIYRNNVSALECFIERMKVEEFINLLKEHPVVLDLKKPIEGTLPPKKFYIDFEGLAQHYELKTELMDFSGDPFVAAFFAVTKYDKKLNKYLPIIRPSSKPGIIYIYKIGQSIEEFTQPYMLQKIKPISLQPFSRPGEQAAYLYRLGGKNLNEVSCIEKYFFYHRKEDSLKIYDMFDGGDKLFPYDSIQKKVSFIKKQFCFSEEVFFSTYRKYGNNNVKKIKKYLNKIGVVIKKDKKRYFTEDEIIHLKKQWKMEKKEFISKIRIRLQDCDSNIR